MNNTYLNGRMNLDPEKTAVLEEMFEAQKIVVFEELELALEILRHSGAPTMVFFSTRELEESPAKDFIKVFPVFFNPNPEIIEIFTREIGGIGNVEWRELQESMMANHGIYIELQLMANNASNGIKGQITVH